MIYETISERISYFRTLAFFPDLEFYPFAKPGDDEDNSLMF